jgi:hypothetical protein
MIISKRVGVTIGNQSTSCGNVLEFKTVVPAEWTRVIMILVRNSWK